MAAPLITAGLVIESWSLSQNETIEERIEQLKSLPKGTTVTYQSPGSTQIVYGQFDGFQDGLFHLTVAEKKGKTKSQKRLPLSLAPNIKVANRQLKGVPIRRRRRSLAVQTGLTSLIAQTDITSSLIVPKLGCTLISKSAKVRSELDEHFISLLSDTQLAGGTLQDLIKLDSLTDKKTLEPYTTKFVSVDSKPNPPHNLTPVVVFDGCRGYLARYRDWENSTRIVVADRSESTYTDLTTAINSDLLYDKERIDLQLPTDIPDGVEIVGYVQ